MRRWLPVFFLAGAVLFSIVVYSRLPDQVPVHWGLSGEPDRYGSRLEGAFVVPAIMAFVFALMRWLPSRDPRAANIAKFRDTYDLSVLVVMAFMTAVHVFTLGVSLGWAVNIMTVVLVGLGLLFVVLGNVLPRARSNFVFGIRTPWTLSSDAVWTRSNRVGGYAMVAAGLVTIAAAFMARPLGFAVALTSIMLGALTPIVYSYVLWARERDGGTDSKG